MKNHYFYKKKKMQGEKDVKNEVLRGKNIKVNESENIAHQKSGMQLMQC